MEESLKQNRTDGGNCTDAGNGTGSGDSSGRDGGGSPLAALERIFQLKSSEPSLVSPLVLAYLGDAVFELAVRTILAEQSTASVSQLHRRATQIVKAQNQSKMVAVLEPYFTEEEAKIYRRGRNAKSPTSAKNADIVDYRRATGLETLMGYLYLDRQGERLLELVRIGLTAEEK